MNALAEDNKLSIESLSALEKLVRERQLQPIVITGHTGWSDDLDFVFAHTDCVCHATKKQKPHDPDAPYDAYDEADCDNAARFGGGGYFPLLDLF